MGRRAKPRSIFHIMNKKWALALVLFALALFMYLSIIWKLS